MIQKNSLQKKIRVESTSNRHLNAYLSIHTWPYSRLTDALVMHTSPFTPPQSLPNFHPIFSGTRLFTPKKPTYLEYDHAQPMGPVSPRAIYTAPGPSPLHTHVYVRRYCLTTHSYVRRYCLITHSLSAGTASPPVRMFAGTASPPPTVCLRSTPPSFSRGSSSPSRGSTC